MNDTTREALVCFGMNEIWMLIPKKRGEGFLKTPQGHHVTPLSELSYEIGCDIFGLDGQLSLQTGYIIPTEQKRQAAINRAVFPVCNLLGIAYRVVGRNEFYDKHPIKKNGVGHD